ncbi:thioredoxin domain-containing protein 5-like [Branchiostoma floridae]|uniref:Thioredoxin domain-containing protein 5-like n=1 Tax=Branchiostoma floridae TaxID=7739 RepID=A0A9J7HLB8_BRAFL|nr:thioredoxin domain-containing protein 5-like [Branchiostoma floridae]
MDHCKTACIILLAVICVVTVATQGQELLYRHLLPRPWYYRHNFEEAVQMIPHFIMFFTPGCEQCKAMMPNFDEVADKYNTMKTPQVILAKVDCSAEVVICEKQGIRVFPTFKMYRHGADNHRYNGERTVEAFKSYISSMVPPVKKTTPEVKGTVYRLASSNFTRHIQGGLHFVKFFAPWCGHCKKLAPAWVKLALSFSNEKHLTIAEVDCVEYDVLCKKYDVDKFPTLMMFRDGKEVDRHLGEQGLEDLESYLSEKLEETISYWERTGLDPGNPAKGKSKVESKVLILTKDNFHSVIRKGMTFVQFYAPWCDHCKTLLPAWDALSFKFPKRPHIQIAKMDCTAHGNNKICQDQKITDYPTLILFKSGRHIGEFGGDENFEWTVDSMHNFVATSLHVHDDL